MTMKTDLKLALGNIAAGAAMSQMPGQLSKIYELWILFKLADHLRSNKWTVELRGFDDKPISRFIERGNPGYIHPKAVAGPKPSFVLLTRPKDGKQFELHNSVRFEGRSTALHEFDVCLISREIGDSLRTATVKRAAIGHPMLTIECKHYSGDAGIGVSRAAIGTLFDATHWNQPALRDQGVQEGGDVVPFISLVNRMDHAFATIIAPRKYSSGATKLADEYKLRLFPRINARKKGKLPDFLKAAEQWLGAYKG